MAIELYEPAPRYGHTAAAFDGKVYIWGGKGRFGHFPPSVIEIFDTETGCWQQCSTRGESPPALIWNAYTTVKNKLYIFGGNDGMTYHNSIYELDLMTLEWKHLKAKPLQPSTSHTPKRKEGSSMVAFEDGDETFLIVFGGSTSSGYTNELHVFKISECTWHSPQVSGTPPEPRYKCSFAKIKKHSAVLFGGTGKGDSSNGIYVLETQQWQWMQVATTGPSGRNLHATCCIEGPLVGSEYAQIMVIGGLDENYRVAGDARILKLKSYSWASIKLPDSVAVRCGHTATLVASNNRSPQVVVFGGATTKKEPLAATAVLTLEYPNATSLYGLCLDHITNHFSSYAPFMHYVSIPVEQEIKQLCERQNTFHSINTMTLNMSY